MESKSKIRVTLEIERSGVFKNNDIVRFETKRPTLYELALKAEKLAIIV